MVLQMRGVVQELPIAFGTAADVRLATGNSLKVLLSVVPHVPDCIPSPGPLLGRELFVSDAHWALAEIEKHGERVFDGFVVHFHGRAEVLCLPIHYPFVAVGSWTSSRTILPSTTKGHQTSNGKYLLLPSVRPVGFLAVLYMIPCTVLRS